MTDEPEAPPIEHTIDALRYMMARLNRPQPEKRLPTILTPEVAKDALDAGIDLGSAFVVVTWTPDGLRYQPITEEDFYTTGVDLMGESVPEGVERHWIPRPDWMRLAGYGESPPLSNQQLSKLTDKFHDTGSSGGNIGGNGSETT